MPNRLITLSLGLFILMLVGLGCGGSGDTVYIDDVADAEILPYRFNVEQTILTTINPGATKGKEYIPIELADTYGGICHIQHNWLPEDTLTCVVFSGKIDFGHTISHRNVKTATITSTMGRDYDHDGTDEMALTYPHRDSLWLHIMDPHGEDLGLCLVAVGEDRDGSGKWDGTGILCGSHDIDHDGFDEVFAWSEVGYDLYPRQLVCYSWQRDTILWTLPMAGSLGERGLHFELFARSDTLPIIIGMASKGNAAVTETMDDEHSYLLGVNRDGTIRWQHTVSTVYTCPLTSIIDYDDDGADDILVGYNYKPESDSSETATPWHGRFDIRNADGSLMDRIELGSGQPIAWVESMDTDGDGATEPVISLANGEIWIVNDQLEKQKVGKFYARALAWECRDFLGNGSHQMLVSTRDSRTWLVSSDFEPLAVFDTGLTGNMSRPYRLPGNRDVWGLSAGINDGQINHFISFKPTAWYAIFFRKPWLAALIVFLPMATVIGLIGAYTWSVRKKNAQIRAARDKLSAALTELEETQRKLVAAEKFRQAKDIAGGFAHEIRNALFPARSALNRLKTSDRDHVDPAKLELAALHADQAVTRAVELTRKISQYTRLDSQHNPQPVNLSQVVKQVLQNNHPLIEERQVAVSIEGPDDTLVESQTDQLILVLNNLLLNSLDALTDTPRPVILISWVLSDGGLAVLNFVDNGQGIPSTDEERVFDAFFTTKPRRGTGLGLSMAKQILEMYDGSIEIDVAAENTTMVLTFRVVN